MTDANLNLVWDVVFDPFGSTTYLHENPAKMDVRFPGQWFQLETGLAYNWHRHYDPTLGRYIQPDPLTVDEGDTAVKGLTTDLSGSRGLVGSSDAHATAKSMGWQEAHDIIMSWPSSRSMLQDGPSLYGYAGQNAGGRTDPQGLMGSRGPQTGTGAAACLSTPMEPCQPCVPPVGTIAYRIDRSPPSRPHYPFTGDHTHLYIMNQNPIDCECYWNKLDVIDGETPPPGSIPMPK
jgi:RHS repeat-associated protein